jgi:mono/diheme cytochrome c family protein
VAHAGKGYAATRFSGLFYVPTNNLCMDYQTTDASYVAGTPYLGANAPYRPGAGGHLGAFIAWDAVHGKKVWEIREPYPVWSGALATAGGVVFYGTLDGWFKAVDARKGTVLWKMKIGSGVVGNPPPATELRNPVKADSATAEEGRKLFEGFNCAGCHGGGAVGNMGPSLADGRCRYGGSDGEILHSIFYGRPRGMPAFGGTIPTESIWRIVVYLRLLQPSKDALATSAW